MIATSPITVGARVQAGQPGTEDHDTGRVVEVSADGALVAWDSGVRTTTPLADLSPIGAKFYEFTITACGSGFGEWQQSSERGEGWEDESLLLGEIRTNLAGFELCELGLDTLPEGLLDIRGSIHGECGRIFGWLDDMNRPCYFAIAEIA